MQNMNKGGEKIYTKRNNLRFEGLHSFRFSCQLQHVMTEKKTDATPTNSLVLECQIYGLCWRL